MELAPPVAARERRQCRRWPWSSPASRLALVAARAAALAAPRAGSASRCCRRWRVVALDAIGSTRTRRSSRAAGSSGRPRGSSHWLALRAAEARGRQATPAAQNEPRRDRTAAHRARRCRRSRWWRGRRGKRASGSGAYMPRGTRRGWPAPRRCRPSPTSARDVRYARLVALAARRRTATPTRSAPARRSRRCSRSGSPPSTCCRPGSPAPLPYVPLANPLDVTLVAALAALWSWARRFAAPRRAHALRLARRGAVRRVNGVVLRTAHHWGDMPWRWSALLASKPLQAALTLTWTATALPLMVIATPAPVCGRCGWSARRCSRSSWRSCSWSISARCPDCRASSRSSASACCCCVIGYLSPLPPGASPRTRGLVERAERCPTRGASVRLAGHARRRRAPAATTPARPRSREVRAAGRTRRELRD